MSKPLQDLTNAELSEVFAVEVAGWRRTEQFERDHFAEQHGKLVNWASPDKLFFTRPSFADSADAVLPYLNERQAQCTRLDSGKWRVSVFTANHSQVDTGTAGTLARAACIALITAKRAEKEASKA